MKSFLINLLIVFVLSILPNYIIGVIRLKRDEPISYVLNEKKSFKASSKVFSINKKPIYIRPRGDLSKLPLFKGVSVMRFVDNFGFSNIQINDSPEILYVGDSFLNDQALNTSDGIQSKTNKLLNRNVAYSIGNAGRAGFRVYNQLRKSTFKKNPSLIIFEVVERHLYEVLINAPNELRSNKTFPNGYFYFDLFFGNNLQDFSFKKLFDSPSKTPRTPLGVARTHNGSKVWFINNKTTLLSDDSLNAIVDSMLDVKSMLEDQKIKIVFVIAPDKESIYPELFGQSSLKALHAKMKARNLDFIDMLSLLENQGENYYYAGDTHWNENSVRLLTEEVAKKYRHFFLSNN
jgi:hypothetical protein